MFSASRILPLTPWSEEDMRDIMDSARKASRGRAAAAGSIGECSTQVAAAAGDDSQQRSMSGGSDDDPSGASSHHAKAHVVTKAQASVKVRVEHHPLHETSPRENLNLPL